MGALLALAAITLVGCGQKGPLYLPDKRPTAVPATATPTTATAAPATDPDADKPAPSRKP
jgi:predicted small lipoprotein YifL